MSRSKNLTRTLVHNNTRLFFSTVGEREAYESLQSYGSSSNVVVTVNAASTIQPGSPLVSAGVTNGVLNVTEPIANTAGQTIVGIYSGSSPASGSIEMLVNGKCDVKVTSAVGDIVEGRFVTANVASGSTDEFKLVNSSDSFMQIAGGPEYLTGNDYYSVSFRKPFAATT